MSERTLEQALKHAEVLREAEEQQVASPDPTYLPPGFAYQWIADVIVLADEVKRLQIELNTYLNIGGSGWVKDRLGFTAERDCY